MASALSSTDSCSRMTTCTPATRTTTGLLRALRPLPCPPKASLFSIPWMSIPSPRRPCSLHQTPSPPWVWHPVWSLPRWLVCQDPVSTASITWTTLATPLWIREFQRRRVLMLRRRLPTCIGTLATPVWPAWDWRQSSIRVLDMPVFRTRPPTSALANTLWIDRSNYRWLPKLSNTGRRDYFFIFFQQKEH